MMKSDHSVCDEKILRLVVDGTVSETGTEFFLSLVKNLSEALGIFAAWVTEYNRKEHKLRAYAMWANGAYVDHYEYDLEGTPCQAAVEQKQLVHFPERLIELFPIDSDLLKMGAVSYLGIPMLDTDGTVLGHLGVLDNKPMHRDPQAIALFEIFAARATGEMRRLKAENEIRSREQQLTQLIQNTMDAIIVLDNDLRLIRVNPAAERLFGCTSEDLVDESMEEFVVKGSESRLEKFRMELDQRPAGQQQLWVPKGFIFRRWDHTVFPAEVTYSRFETRDGAFYTLILRNADERLEAVRQIEQLTREAELLREVAREALGNGEILGRSDCMQAVEGAIQQVAPTDSTVLVLGKTGTGKELVARSIHKQSLRADKPLILVNCAAIPANLIESEFFGHEKGAFTGAVQQRQGRFELANGGTIFLDEVGELPLELQSKLLRVLQEGEFEPLGSSRTVKVDVRIIAATHRDLREMVSSGVFREDLYFRLHVFPIEIPPLKQRGKDVEYLASAFKDRFAKRMGKQIQPLSPEQLTALHSYDWPGNVRELQNVVERAVILTTGSILALERSMCGVDPVHQPAADPAGSPGTRILNAKQMEAAERENFIRALEECNWKVSGESGAARLLGIPPTTLSSRMKTLKISRP